VRGASTQAPLQLTDDLSTRRNQLLASKRDALVKLAILTALALATVAIAAFAFAGKGGEPSSPCGLGKPASPPGQNDDLTNGRSSEAMHNGQTCHAPTE
jgi:hypothetical protein